MLDFILYSIIISWLIWYIFLEKDPAPIFGVYSQPGKWFSLKYWLFYAAIKLRQKNVFRCQGAGYGVKSKPDISQMDKVQKLPENEPSALDAIYFNASNAQGFYFGAAMARRHKGLAQTFLIVRVPNLGLLELPCAPDTHLRVTKAEAHAAGGLEMTPVEPMKKWRIRYKGEVKVDGQRLEDIEIDLNWTACTDYFDYDTDMNPKLLAKAVAAEPWSREFFERLRTTHQTHYEQFGDYEEDVSGDIGDTEAREPEPSLRHLLGHLTMASQSKPIPLKMRGLRDHSYGVRDWKYFHRYILNFFHLEDGTCTHVGVVSMPNVTFSHLEFGFLCTPSGEKMSIDEMNMPLHLVGETDHDPPPSKFQFNFRTTDGKRYDVECKIVDGRPYYYGEEWEGMIWEQLGEFVCNGVKGWGLSEWEYRYLSGRPEKTDQQP